MACPRLLPPRPRFLARRALLEAAGRERGYELAVLALSCRGHRGPGMRCALLVWMAGTTSEGRAIRLCRAEDDAEGWDGVDGV